MNKCKTKPCGCKDVGLKTPTPCNCNTDECPTPEYCSELFSDNCILHTNDSIVDLNIKQGERSSSILQKLILGITNPTCVIPGSPCASALNFKSNGVTSSSIKLIWQAVSDSSSYVVQYKTLAAVLWTSNPSVTGLTDTIQGLTPYTQYHVRVNTVCGVTKKCFSVTLLITTKPA